MRSPTPLALRSDGWFQMSPYLLYRIHLLFVLLLQLLPLSSPCFHLCLVMLLQGKVGCMADGQGLLQLCMLTGKGIMICTLISNPPAAAGNILIKPAHNGWWLSLAYQGCLLLFGLNLAVQLQGLLRIYNHLYKLCSSSFQPMHS